MRVTQSPLIIFGLSVFVLGISFLSGKSEAGVVAGASDKVNVDEIVSSIVSTPSQDFAIFPDDLVNLFDNSVRVPQTSTSFDVVTEPLEEILPFETVYEETNELVLGEEKVAQAGVEGRRVGWNKVYIWDGWEYDEVFTLGEFVEPIDQVIKVGIRRDPKTIDTPEGPITYYQKLNVWSTSYDGNCVGCTGRTYTGTSVVHGTCAVDPTVIALGSYFYVPGYGICHAEDIGGAIKGNKIDLGFEDVRQGWWSARWVDIYLLD